MAVEIATAYVNLVASARGIGASIAKELTGPLDAAALTAGKRTSASLGSSFLSGAGSIAKKATLPFVGIGVAAVASAKSVEDAENTIIRTTGATGASAEGLVKSFRKIAANTPASFGTVATTLAEVSQRTGLTGKRLEDLTLQVITFNRITKDSPIAVQDLTKALSSFNVPGTKMGAVLDRLFVTSQKTGVPLAELVSTLQSAGPVVRQFGLPIEQSAGLLATLNKAGVDSGPAIFGLRKAFTEFAKAGKDPKIALQGVIGEIQKLAKAGDLAGARKIGVNLFGARGVGIVDAAVSGKLSLEALTKTFDSTGKGIRATAASTTTMSAKLGVLKNNAQLALAQLGGPLLNIATAGLKAIVPIVQNLANAFGLLPGPVQGIAVSLVALGAVAGPITKLAKGIAGIGKAAIGAGKAIVGATRNAVAFFTTGRASNLGRGFLDAGKSVLSFGKNVVVTTANIVKQTVAFLAQKAAMLAAAAAQKILTAAQWLLNAAMTANPIGLIVAAIAALAVGIFIAYKKFKPFRDVVDAVGRALVAVARVILGSLKAAFNWIKSHWPVLLVILTGPFGLAVLFITKNFSKITDVVSGVFDWIKKHWPLLLGILTGPFGLAVLAIVKFGPKILQGITTAFGTVVNFFKQLPGRILGALGSGGSFLLEVGKRIIGGLVEGFKFGLALIVAFYVKLPVKILSLLAGAAKWLLAPGKQILGGLFRGITAGSVAVFTFFSAIKSRVLGLLGDAISWLRDVGLKIISGLFGGIKAAVAFHISFFTPGGELNKKIVAAMSSAASWLVKKGVEILIGLGNGIVVGAGAVLGWIAGLKDRVIGAIGDAGSWLVDVGRKIIDGLIHGVTGALGKLKDTLGGIGRKIISWKGPPAKDAVLLKPIGRLLISGLIKGIEGKLSDLRKTLGAVATTITADARAPEINAPTIRAAAPKLTLQPILASSKFDAQPQQFVYQQNAPVYGVDNFERMVEHVAIKGIQNRTNKNAFVRGARVAG